DQAVGRPERQAVDQLLQKICHLSAPPTAGCSLDAAQLMRKLARDRKARHCGFGIVAEPHSDLPIDTNSRLWSKAPASVFVILPSYSGRSSRSARSSRTG